MQGNSRLEGYRRCKVTLRFSGKRVYQDLPRKLSVFVDLPYYAT